VSSGRDSGFWYRLANCSRILASCVFICLPNVFVSPFVVHLATPNCHFGVNLLSDWHLCAMNIRVRGKLLADVSSDFTFHTSSENESRKTWYFLRHINKTQFPQGDHNDLYLIERFCEIASHIAYLIASHRLVFLGIVFKSRPHTRRMSNMVDS